LDLINN